MSNIVNKKMKKKCLSKNKIKKTHGVLKKTKPTRTIMNDEQNLASEVALVRLDIKTMRLVLNGVEIDVMACNRLISALCEERDQLKARVCALENTIYTRRRYDDVLQGGISAIQKHD